MKISTSAAAIGIGVSVLLGTSTTVLADSWTSKDKAGHAIVGAWAGVVTTLASSNPRYGCVAATSVGLAKEIYDLAHRQHHTPSVKDFVVTAAVGCAAAYTTGLIVAPGYVGWSMKF